jgi:hypothetical protein
MTDKVEPPVIATRVAHAGFDEHVFFGHPIFGQLAGRTTSSGMFLLALTGRVASDEDCTLVDDFMACVTMADPRIWPLKITRTVGSYGNFLPALAAGYLAIDEGAVGPASVEPAMHQMRELVLLTDGRVRDVEAVERAFAELRRRTPQLAGFGVPFRRRDERVEALCVRVRARGRHERTYWALLETLREILRRGEKKLELNLASAMAALALDLEIEPAVGPLLGTVLLSPCFFANASEASREPASALRNLPDSHVEYVGKPRRRSAADQRLR